MKNIRTFRVAFMSLALAAASARAAQFTNAPAPTPEQIAAQNRAVAGVDFQQMLDQLGVPQPPFLPPVADDPTRPQNTHAAKPDSPTYKDEAGRIYQRSIWGTWSNYEESKANPYNIPDALALKNGEPVKDPETWWKKRRPEILSDFVTYVYGRSPEKMPYVTWSATNEEMVIMTNSRGGTLIAQKKNLSGKVANFFNSKINVDLDLTLFTPARATRPVPVILIATGSARHGVAYATELLLEHGWGCAVFNTDSIQPDNGAGLTQGLIGLMSDGYPRKPEDWGALAAWSWGLSYSMDYLGTDHNVDGSQVGLAGLSRWGKEALMTMAFDPRFAVVYCSCSGEGGAKLHRRNYGETVDNIAGPYAYHWMAGNFLKFAKHWDQLPVDANELIALCAPRPVFVTGGTEDQWADPKGEFMACVGASPVYELLHKKGVGTDTMPDPDVELISGDIGFRLHKGGHSDAPDWPTFIKFADKYLKAK